ncbi:MAG: indolepyruvate ferredoxin oxidoreductase subunit alpha [Clostridia bacterium]|nr:indolepyruvate ferredoxin oxidoreductase subunit alpha [Clostridia bacterium]MDD4048772.1 indolepyruvate ferredoxin oxidoreductase subunit alpha [Clostridia bacterium]
MKKLMTGNEAIARGVYEAGCTVAAAYPGTPSTEILENVAKYEGIYSEWSPNEKVALEVASGASIAGARSLAAMKHVGLNVAADPFFTMAYEGVNGGFVIVTADDPGTHSSQNEQDNRYYAPHAKVILIEPADSQECKDFVKNAFELSEKYDSPVLLRVTTRICHSKGLVELGEREEVGVKEYKKDTKKYAMTPANAKVRHIIVEEKLNKLREYTNSCPLNRIEWGDKKIGIITSGISYQHSKEVFGENASYLKLGLTYPLPNEMILKFAQTVDEVYIVEENDPYLESYIKSLGIDCKGKELIPICGELNPGIIKNAFFPEEKAEAYEAEIKVPSRPPVLCAGCPHRGLFYALSKYKDIVVSGDIGCYTLGLMPPLSVTDSVICMGASISAGIGFEKAFMQGGTKKKVFSCIGDSTFFHSGITGLIDAVYNKSKISIVIMDNRITAMTGHQENPGTGKTLRGEETTIIDIEKIVVAVGIKQENIRTVDPYNLEETQRAVKEAYEAQEPFVIITKRPCALIKKVQKARTGIYCVFDDEKCKKCKACLKIGCPAISFKGGQITIDGDMCNGCGICQQVCKFNAITKVGE